jgi:uncharacterized protein YebE (UPF0316 family)
MATNDLCGAGSFFAFGFALRMDWHTPLLIFLARICDVSVGTMRIVAVTRGRKIMAAFLGFFEVTIWLLAASQIFANMANIRENLLNVAAYGMGFSMGTLAGMAIEEKLAIGHLMVRIVTQEAGASVAAFLRQQGFVITEVEASGALGPHELCFALISRRDLTRLLDLLRQHNPRAVVTVENVEVRGGPHHLPNTPERAPMWRRLRLR